MYNNLIILTQLIQHSSGSSPHHHLHTSCFHFIWLMCFPTSFYMSLSLLSSLLSCCACPPLYFFPASHPAFLCHLFAFKLLSLQSPWWSSISLDFCLSSSISASPSCQLSGNPKWLCFLSARFFPSAPPISRSSLSLPAGYCCSVSQGPNSCIPSRAVCVHCLSNIALFGTPDLQTLSLEGYRRGRQRTRWWDTIPGLNRHGFEKTLGDTGLAKSRNEQPHLPMLLTLNSPETMLFSEVLSFPHPLPSRLILFHEGVSSKFLTTLFTAMACPCFSQFSISLGVAVCASPDPAFRPLFTE